MKGSTIKKGAMTIIKEKIDTAQAEYEEGCKELDAKVVIDKQDLATRKINEVVGKIV